jgi:taurine dioxygenase
MLQQLLVGLEMEFDMGPSKLAARELYGEDYYQQLLANEPVARHPLVRVHPVTGRRALYLGGAFMRGIVGMHANESAAIVAFLQSRLDDPNIQVRWRWRQHDVVMWDERCTNHRALSDHWPSHRHERRCVVGRGVPVGP